MDEFQWSHLHLLSSKLVPIILAWLVTNLHGSSRPWTTKPTPHFAYEEAKSEIKREKIHSLGITSDLRTWLPISILLFGAAPSAVASEQILCWELTQKFSWSTCLHVRIVTIETYQFRLEAALRPSWREPCNEFATVWNRSFSYIGVSFSSQSEQ